MKKFGQIVKEARAGIAESQYQLGMIYYEGKIVELNKKEAYKWLQRSAQKKYGKAINQINKIIATGENAPEYKKKLTIYYKIFTDELERMEDKEKCLFLKSNIQRILKYKKDKLLKFNNNDFSDFAV